MPPISLHLEKLTPIDHAQIEVYSEALDYAFAHSDIKNVAITGPYGAGKSSVLESYKKDKNFSFLHISLAHFEAACEGESEQVIEGVKKSEVLLEGKILNQLLHQIDPSQIPQSHFKIKTQSTKWDSTKTAFPLILAGIVILYWWNFSEVWQRIEDWLGSARWLSSSCNFSLLLLILGIVCYLTYLLVHGQKNKYLFRKIALYGNEIEIFEHNTESFFDKYLNEVLYLFNHAGTDVIVFEDMDRFNYNQIFEKLREINYLVNKKQVGRVIRFFYLLRDDIFTSKDRSKFFDFIIPVVPIVDGSNSYDLFVEQFKKAGILQDFDAEFLRGISLYIDDMRILKNICNEYQVYYHRLKSSELELDGNKLFAIIAYKNLFPKDFSDSQLNKGFVCLLFALKENFVQNEIQELESRINQNQKLICEAEKGCCDDLDELDAVYLKLPEGLKIDNKTVEQFATRLDFVRAIKSSQTSVYTTNYNGQRTPFNLQKKLSELAQIEEYQKRKTVISEQKEKVIQKFREVISDLLNRISDLRESRLQGVLTKENIDSFFSGLETKNDLGEVECFESVKRNFYFPLLKYLVRNGYIDESYQDYMTYFYENSISRIDKIFLRSVTDEKMKEFSYGLNNLELVIRYLSPASFDQEEILNFDLFSYLLCQQEKYCQYLIRFIKQLENHQRFDFVAQFFEKNRETKLFVGALNHYWPPIWKGICTNDSFTDQERHRYAIVSLYFSLDQDLIAMNGDNCLSDYISLNPNFLQIENPDIETIKAKLCLLEIRFEKINYDNANSDLLAEVYHSDLYAINAFMIYLILEKFYGLTKSEDYEHCNYSLIRSKSDESLLRYVNANIVEYFDLMMSQCKSKILDDEATVVGVLNNEEIDEERKKQYIEFLHTKIKSIENVDEKELWPAIFSRLAVEYSAENILEYFFHSDSEIDDTLVAFINSGSQSVSFGYDQIEESFGEGCGSNFLSAIIKCLNLDDKKYRLILKSLNRTYSKFQIEGISDSKISILVELRVIGMSKENLLFMREKYPGHVREFILSNPSKYASEAVAEDSFQFNELEIAFDSQSFKDPDILKLLTYAKDTISVIGKKCSTEIKLHLLQNHFHADDLPVLAKCYDSEPKQLQEQIGLLCQEQLNSLLSKKVFWSFNLLTSLLTNDSITEDRKISLLANALPGLEPTQTKSCFKLLNMAEYIELFERKRPKIAKNAYSDKLLPILRDKEWITFTEETSDEAVYYQANGKKAANC